MHKPIDAIISLISAAWRRRHMIVVPIILMPLLGLVSGLLAPKKFEARTTLLVQEPAKLNPFLNDLAVGTNVKDRMPALSALLHSQHVLDKVLMDTGQITTATSPSEREVLIARLSAAITVKLTGSDLIEIKVSGRRPQGLLRSLQSISNRFVERVVSPEQGAIVASQSFLETQLGQRREALAKAEKDYADFKVRHADKLPAIYAANVTRLGQLQQKLQEREMELATAQAGFSDIRQRIAGANPVIGRLEDEIVKLTGELTTLRSRYTDEHSQVQNIERQLKRTQEERRSLLEASSNLKDLDLDRLWNIAANMAGGDEAKQQTTLLMSQMQRLQDAQAKRVTLEKDVDELRRMIGELQTTIGTFAPIEQEQQSHERAIAAAREMFDNLLKRSEMARVTGALGRFEAPERIKVIDPPTEPSAPTGPGLLLFLIGGIVGGIFLGAGMAACAELMDQRLRKEDQFTGGLAIPVLGRLPNISHASIEAS
jgi:polysaccharide chain length determinant protein (PEP-CTERM system associated)